MQGLMQDLRVAVRLLLKEPGFAATSIVILALGIGANTAMFSVVDAVLLRAPAYADPDRLVVLRQTTNGEGETNLAPPDFLDIRRQSRSLSKTAAYTNVSVSLAGDGRPERLAGGFVSSDWFRILGREPLLGRTFSSEEGEVGGSSQVVVLSHGLWHRRFGSDVGVIGRTLTINGESHTIIGVMPPDFEPMDDEELWLPLVLAPEDLERGRSFVHVLSRLTPGINTEQAQAEIDNLASELARQYPATNTGRGFKIVPLQESIVGDVRPALLMLLAAVGFLMLLVCANLMHLELGRALARQREGAIRTALGANRARLVRERLTGTILTSLLGGLMGVLLANWGVRLLVAFAPGLDYIPRLDQARIDGRVVAFTGLIAVLTGLVSGFLPALRATRTELQSLLKEGGKTTGSVRRGRLRSLLLISEVALALILLIGAGLLVRSFRSLLGVDPGFQPERCLAMRVVLPQEVAPEASIAFSRQVLRRLEELPFVQDSGLVTNVPLTTSRVVSSVWIQSQPAPLSGQEPKIDFDAISPGYFKALGIPLLRGRGFEPQDGPDAPPVTIISRTMADKLWPGTDPLGQQVSFQGPEGPWATVVGVVADMKRLGLEKENQPQAYMPFEQSPWFFMTFVVRTAGDPLQAVDHVRRAVWAVDPNQAIAWVRPMSEVVSDSIARPRFSMTLLVFFAGIALLLTAVGIYGVMAHSVGQRVQEIGVRLALGARRGDILRLIMGRALALTLVGLAIGLSVAFGLTRLLASFLFRVSTTDPLTFLMLPIFLIGLAMAATYIPARHATRVAPSTALKHE